MNLEVTFGQSPVEALLAELENGSSLPAQHLLAVLEDEDEDALSQVMQILEQRHITLDISGLPAGEAAGNTAVRLRREKELARKGTLWTQLEENDPLGLYLQELSQLPVAGDPTLLAQQWLDGDEAACQQLVNLQLHQVVELAAQLAGQGVLLLDLIQEGSLGLWQGILHYTGGPVEQHCRWWIRQYMAKAVLQQAISSGLGQKLKSGVRDYVDTDQRLLTELGRNPTVQEIAQAMHISAEDALVYADMLRSAQTRRQIDAQRTPAEPSPEDDQAVEDTAYFQSRQRILELLSALTQQEQTLLTLRYGLSGSAPQSPEQVGAQLGLTPEEVVAMEAEALNKLRQQ